MIAFVLGLSWALRTYVFTAYEIPSGSMEETIMTGDMVFAEKVSYYFRDPAAGRHRHVFRPRDPGSHAHQALHRHGRANHQHRRRRHSSTSTVWPKPKPTPHGKPTLPLTNSTITFPYTVPSRPHLGDGRQSHQLAGFAILRRGPRKLGNGQGRAGILARARLRLAGVGARRPTVFK